MHHAVLRADSILVVPDYPVIPVHIRGALPGILSSVEVCRDDEFMSFIGPAVSEDAGVLGCERLDIAVCDNVHLFSHGDEFLVIAENGVLVLELIRSVDLCVVSVYRDPWLCAVFCRESGIFGVVPLHRRAAVVAGVGLASEADSPLS